MLRNITVFVVIFGSCVIAGFAVAGRSADSKPVPQAIPLRIQAAEAQPAGVADRISIDYELQFTEKGQQPALVKMTLQGRTGTVVRASVDGLEGCKLDIETTSIPGPEVQYTTKMKLVGNVGQDNDIRCRPQLRAFAGIDAGLEVGPYKLRVKVSHLK